jgi:hypothetical protein
MKSTAGLYKELIEALVPAIMEELLEGQEEATAFKLEHLIREVLQEIGKVLVPACLARLQGRYPAKSVPCDCGGRSDYVCQRKGVLISVFGRTEYRRAYYLCKRCHRGQYPLDRQLGLRPGQVSVALGELLGLLGVQTAFEEAARMAEKLLMVQVSENTVRHETQEYGQAQMEREEALKAESHDEQRLQERFRKRDAAPQRLYGSLDGVIIPVDKEWMELKVGCWYEVEENVGPLADKRKARKISYYCDIGSPDLLRPLMWATGYARQADQAQEIVFIADGAHWIWRLVSYHFPHAVQIVDWYHAVTYLKPIAHAVYGEGTPMADAWYEQISTLLWEGEVQQVIDNCRHWLEHPKAAEAASKAVSYYVNNAERMDYARLRAEGYLIGSGVVESACKQIGTQRLKVAGARWLSDGARKTAKARAAWLSHDWAPLTEDRTCLAQAA